MDNIPIKELVSILDSHDDFLILTHTHPDGDTLGSALALTRLLQSIGKKARAVCPEVPNKSLVSLMRGYDFHDDCSPFGFVISVDVAASGMLGKYEVLKDNVGLMIDHHILRSPLCEKVFVFPEAAACGEIIFDICSEFSSSGRFDMTEEIASYLYCAVSSDTGGFIYANTTPRTHETAASLLKYGFCASELDEIMHIRKPLALCRAEKYLFDKMCLYGGGRIGLVSMTSAERESFALPDNELGDIVNIPRTIDCVDIAVSVREQAPGEYKASLRSRGADVSSVAALFGGGGHKRAAGCTIKAADIGTASAMIADACEKILAKE